MATKSVDEIVGSIREGAADTGGKIQEAVEDVAEKVEDALEHARYEGRQLKKKVKAELMNRWKTVDRVGRENAFVMAAVALGVGVLIGYLVSRDRR